MAEGASRATEGAPDALDDTLPDAAPRGLVLRAALGAAVGFAAAWALVTWLTSIGLYGDPSIAVDVRLYQHWGREILLPRVPYLDFGIEYPPLGWATFVVPALIVGPDAGEKAYRLAFQLLMAGCGIALAVTTVATVGALGGGRRELIVAGALVAATPLLIGPTILARFDLWPVLLTGLALWSIASRRDTWAAVFIGLGALAKLYPLLLAPFLVVYVWRRDGPRAAVRWGLVLAFVLLLGFGPFLVLAPADTLSMVVRQLERPLHIETLGAVVLMLLNELAGLPVRVVHSFDSWNLAGALPDAIAAAQTLASIALLGLLLLGFMRARPTRGSLLVAVAAAMCVYVALSKVFSPQYVIWLVPFVAVLPAVPRGAVPRGAVRPSLVAVGLLVAAILLTSLYYPGNYWPFVNGRELGWTLVILARNLLLCGLTASLVLALFDLPRGSLRIRV